MATIIESRSFTGLAALSRVLQGLPAALRTEILAPAVRKAAEPIRRATRNFAPVATGSLKASIDVKVVSDPYKGTAAALIGPNREYYRNGKRLKKGDDRRGAAKPANYAHLVEFGHVVVAPIKGTSLRKKNAQPAANGTSFVAPRPFLRPGFIAGAPEAERILIEEIGKSLDRKRTALIASGAHAA